MGLNGGPNLQDLFNQRFGANAYQSGVNEAYNAGRAAYNAQVQAQQQKLFQQQQATQVKVQKPITDLKNAADYWNDPTNNSMLHQKGAWRVVQDLQNDPELQAQLKAQGYDVKAIADQAYNVATGGQIKSASGFKQFYKDVSPDSATQKQNEQEIQDQIDSDAAKATQAKVDAQNKANYDNSWYGKLINSAKSGLSDVGNAIGGAANQVGSGIGNEYNKVVNDPKGIGNGLYNAGNDFFNGLNELGNRVDDQLTGTFLGQNAVNKEHQQQQNLLNQLKMNPQTAQLAQTNQNIFNQSNAPAKSGLDQLANLAGGTAGNLLPFLVGDGLLGAASKIGKVGEVANNLDPFVQKLTGGALSGGVGAALQSGAQAAVGNNQSPGDVAKNILETAGLGAGGNVLLGGGLKDLLGQLNLKGQAAKLMQDTGSIPYNENMFGQALKEANTPSGDVSNVVADKKPTMPQPFEQKYNLSPQTAPQQQPLNLQGNDWFNFAQQGSNAPQARGWIPDTSIPKAESGSVRSLADDTLNRVNSLNNPPAGGFNQRLLDIQKIMNEPHQANTSISKELKDAIQQQYEYLKNAGGKGTDSGVYTNGQTGNFKEATGGRYSVSNNPKWYQDFYKQNGRAPSNSELKQLAEQHVKNGFQDQLGSIPAWKPQDLQKIHDQMDEVQTMMKEQPEQAHLLAPILQGLQQEEGTITQALSKVMNGKASDINELYSSSRNAKDPKTFDDLIKLAEMEHNVQNPSLKTMLKSDPKIKQALDQLNALGKPSNPVSKLVPDVSPKNKVVTIPELKGSKQSPQDLLQDFKINGGKTPNLADQLKVTKGGKPNIGDVLKSLTMQKEYVLNTVKTEKNITNMSEDELNGVLSKLENKRVSAVKSGNSKQISAIEADIAKVKKALDLQFFSAKANPLEAVREKITGKAPEKTPQDIAREHAQVNSAVKKLDEKGKPVSEETVKAIQKTKDIMPNQTLTKNIYELADRLPKEIGDKIKSSLDAAKENHVNNLEQRSNDLYNKVVKELGIKKGSKESALVQDYGEKTLGKKALEKQGIDHSSVSNEELNRINESELQRIAGNKANDIKTADKYFRENYKKMIDEVNATVKEIYPNNPDKIVPERQDYYHHFNELEGFEGFKNLIQNSAAIDPHLAGISPNTKPNSKWQSFKQMRGNGAYKSDALGGYLKYLQAASHSTHLDPMIKVLRNAADQIATATEGTKNLNNLKTALEVHADNIAGKTNPIDRLFQDHIIGRKAMNVINLVNGHIKKNMILGNLGSALGQVGNVPLTLGKAKQYAPQGLIDTLKYTANHLLGGDKNLSAPINKSQFLKERFSSEYFKRFDNGLLKKPEKMAAWMLETADKSGTYFAWNSMYRKGLAKGVADPIKYADTETRHIIAGRGVGEVPIAQKAKITQLIAPFSLEVGNQWKVLGKQLKEKDFAGVITFLAASYGLNQVMNSLKGSQASLDPIGAALEGYNQTDGTTTDKLKGAGANLLGETVGNIPGGAYIPQIMGLTNPTAKKDIFGNRSPDRFGTGVGVESTAFKPIVDAVGQNWGKALLDALPLALPYGGNQVKKTVGGSIALSKGGSYDSKGNLQYPMDANNVSDLLHALLMGPTSTANGQNYYDNNKKALSTNQTAKYESAPNKQDYYNNLMHQRQVNAIKKKMTDTRNDKTLTLQEKQQNIMILMQKLQNLQK